MNEYMQNKAQTSHEEMMGMKEENACLLCCGFEMYFLLTPVLV
jgi:hypothetical protein